LVVDERVGVCGKPPSGPTTGAKSRAEGDLGRGARRTLVVVGRRRGRHSAARDCVVREIDRRERDELAVVDDRQRAGE
jgi:hypothetical protein